MGPTVQRTRAAHAQKMIGSVGMQDGVSAASVQRQGSKESPACRSAYLRDQFSGPWCLLRRNFGPSKGVATKADAQMLALVASFVSGTRTTLVIIPPKVILLTILLTIII